jgi:uncharacterized membrane protein YadS
MLGGTIHDVAQVVGAGYVVSVPVGNTVMIVKLFRVFLLLPVVLGVGWYFTRIGQKHGEARVPVFGIVFLVLCALNSAIPLMPALLPTYAPIKSVLVEASTWGLLLAIGALGLGTSIKTIVGLGWRHITTVLGTTVVIFAIVTGGLLQTRDPASLTGAPDQRRTTSLRSCCAASGARDVYARVTVSKSAGSTISSTSQSSE